MGTRLNASALYHSYEISMYRVTGSLPAQHLTAGLGYKHLDLPLRGRLAILSIHRPSVLIVDTDSVRSHVHHRLDRKYHPRNHQHFCAAFRDITDERILVEFVAAAVSADLAHDTVSVIQGMSVNSESEK